MPPGVTRKTCTRDGCLGTMKLRIKILVPEPGAPPLEGSGAETYWKCDTCQKTEPSTD